MTPAQILYVAAANIHPETWCQHVYRTSDERGCALWHIHQAGLDAPDDVVKAAVLAVYDGGIGGSLANWNDAKGRTSFDVVELFETVAAKLEETCSIHMSA